MTLMQNLLQLTSAYSLLRRAGYFDKSLMVAKLATNFVAAHPFEDTTDTLSSFEVEMASSDAHWIAIKLTCARVIKGIPVCIRAHLSANGVEADIISDYAAYYRDAALGREYERLTTDWLKQEGQPLPAAPGLREALRKAEKRLSVRAAEWAASKAAEERRKEQQAKEAAARRRKQLQQRADKEKDLMEERRAEGKMTAIPALGHAGFRHGPKLGDDPNDLDEIIARKQYMEVVDAILLQMPSLRYAEVFRMRHIEGRTLDEIGARFGITRAYIREMEAKSFRRLKHSAATGWRYIIREETVGC
jgi:hypothetical protein